MPTADAISRVIRDKDVVIARLARCEAQLKLRIGELFDALFELDGHHELGFSSFEAYVVQRCQRSRSWGRKTRALAKCIRERGLHEIRNALRSGRLGTSMAEVLVRHATHETERELLERASSATVRSVRRDLGGGIEDPAKPGEGEAPTIHPIYWVNENELLMLAASRTLVDYLNGGGANDESLMTALLGEGETTLQSFEGLSDFASLDGARLEAIAAAMREAKLERERHADARAAPVPAPNVLVEVAADEPLPATIVELDREIQHRCADLTARNLELGRLLSTFFAARSWRALGYASASDYANDRLGLSLSSVEHRMTLARRVLRYPRIGEAIDAGDIGYEAALLVSRVVGRFARRELVDAWIERARGRTVRHLREEVGAISTAVELVPETSRFPPSDEDLEAVFEIERKIQSGELLRSLSLTTVLDPQTSITLTSPAGTKRPLRMTISVDLFLHWRAVEAEFRAVAGDRASFIAFLCSSLWTTWLPFLEAWDDKWKHIYRRDRHRCSSPVCERRDVTPHHLHFKAHGGSDAPENLTSLCAWCHLQGIHRGRLRAEGPASHPTWTIGRNVHIVVSGREKIRAR